MVKSVWRAGLSVLVLLFWISKPALAGFQNGVAWQVEDNQLTLNTIHSAYYFDSNWAIQGSFNWEKGDLSIAALYHTPLDLAAFSSYVGIGFRDLAGFGDPASTLLQRAELITALEVDLKFISQGLSTGLELRTVLDQSSHPPGLPPFLALFLNYRAIPRAVSRPGFHPPAEGDPDFILLAKLITAEAGNEPYEGQVAVGAVVLNRIKSAEFPDSIREVIYQPGQFSSLPLLNSTEPTESCLKAAKEALAGIDPSHGALFFYNPATSSPAGLRFFATANLRITVRIGNHVFLK
ncbi:MAG: cell wall hydrolase [Firmicutes bacterium]|nr:cell wall hydrolase [Bacillota bacterium]